MSINQSEILEKINIYLSEQNRPKYAESGVCNGLVALFCLKGKDWLNKLLVTIATCPDKNISENIGLEIEKLLGHIEWLQNSVRYLPDVPQSNISKAVDVINKPEAGLTKEFSLACVFKEQELTKILNDLTRHLQQIKSRANPNLKDSDDYLPLDIAVNSKNLDCVRTLCQRKILILEADILIGQKAKLSEKASIELNQFLSELNSFISTNTVSQNSKRAEELCNILGCGYTAGNKFNEAITMFQKAFALKPTLGNFYQVILTMIDHNKFGEAQNQVKNYVNHLVAQKKLSGST